MTQDVKRITLSSAVKEQGDLADESQDVISEFTYIFEPDIYSVVAHLERSMLSIALSQLVLDSKLAQYASRFRAMSASHEMAEESLGSASLRLNRAKRAIKDERLKEMINGIRKKAVEGAN